MKTFLFVILFFLISSCSLFRVSGSNKLSDSNILDSVFAKTSNFETLSFSFVAKYSDSQNNLSFFGKTQIIKDSVLFMEISPGLGITLAELYATPDTFLIFFPLKNNYYAGNSNLLLNNYGIPFDFISLQNILTASFFSYPYFIDIEDYEFVYENSVFSYKNVVFNKAEPKKIDVLHTFIISNLFFIDEFTVFDYVLHKDLVCKYSKYRLYNDMNLPENIDLTLISIDTVKLNLKRKKVVFNDNLKINFVIPNDAQIIIN